MNVRLRHRLDLLGATPPFRGRQARGRDHRQRVGTIARGRELALLVPVLPDALVAAAVAGRWAARVFVPRAVLHGKLRRLHEHSLALQPRDHVLGHAVGELGGGVGDERVHVGAARRVALGV